MNGRRIREALVMSFAAAGVWAVLGGCAGGRRQTEPTLFAATGEQNVIQTVDQFRAFLGTNNVTQVGPIPTGRREINWDGVPAAQTNTNTFPGNFFSVNSGRGLVVTTPGTGLRVSDNNFSDVNATYATQVGT